MINVSDELKNAVINEEMPKTITASPVELSVDDLNWFNVNNTNEWSGLYSFSSVLRQDISNEYRCDYIDIDEIRRHGKVNFSLNIRITSMEESTAQLWLYITQIFSNGTESTNGVSKSGCVVGQDYVLSKSYIVASTDWDRTVAIKIAIGVGSATNSIGLQMSKPFICMSDDTSKRMPFDYIGKFATPANVALVNGSNSFVEVSNPNVLSEAFGFEESICSADTLKIGGCETSKLSLTVFNAVSSFQNGIADISLDINSKGAFNWKGYQIKKVTKESRGGSVLKKLDLYDKSYRLSENAYSWYSQYMWGMNMDRQSQYANYHFDYERNIFSAYWNLARSFGVEDEDRLEIDVYHRMNMPYETDGGIYFDYCDASHGYNRLYYRKYSFSHSGYYTAFMVDYIVENETPNYGEYFDSIMRGASDKGSIFAEFFDSNGDNVLGEGGYLYDCRDIILPPEGTKTITIYVPYVCSKPPYQSQDNAYPVTTEAWVYGVNFKDYSPYDIINSTAPLPYYSYIWRKPSATDICRADSSITARDVMRSLMEMCGCFYRISRDGKPQFIYAQEHGLYPSNTLFPSDNLFPKKSGEMTMPTSYYMTAEFAEFQVEKYGGVQVVVRTKDNTGAVVRWEYWEDDSSDSAYLIDDNIFLCAEEFVYDRESTSNIDTLLQNLFGCLDNLQYTPFTAETIGTPFLESGDRFTLLTQTDGFESFIFERKLKGIQALKDHFEARGIAKTPRVKNFEWEQ